MGQLVSQPITDKTIKLTQLQHLSHAIGEMQGYRVTMEDEHCDFNGTYPELSPSIILKSHEPNNDFISSDQEKKSLAINDLNNDYINYSIYGVFDGHGGSSTSKFLGEHLPKIIKQELIKEFSNLNSIELNDIIKNSKSDILKYINFPIFLKNCFMKLDSIYYQYESINSSGSTAVVALIIKNYIIIANSGDSRCILSNNGNSKILSIDHKPKLPGELIRIQNAGGFVKNDRVNSILALSRAFGDFSFKLQTNNNNNNNNSGIYYQRSLNHYNYRNRKNLIPPEEYQVTVEPDINIHKLNSLDEFIVLACDGIWDCYKSHDLINFIRHQLSLGKKLNDIVQIILDHCIQMANTITGIGFDNMTIIIIALHDDKILGSSNLNLNSNSNSMDSTKLDSWYSMMKNRVLDEKFGKIGH